MTAPKVADEVERHIGDDPFAHQVHGMLRLSAALAREIEGDHGGGRPGPRGGPARRALGRRSQRLRAVRRGQRRRVADLLAVEAGEPGQALRYAEQVDPRALASDNRRAALRIEKARAHAMLGRDADAVRELRQAERLSPAQTHSNALTRELVADMLRRTGGRDLRGLAWRMNLI
ncbi:hypothetical protein [Thermocatellispora tengchongensis]|uniref:hypothetical protein n=1 Tax=Thermocatellispora tengchongensis TaxID=1073253 RepID=UPI00362DCF89